MKGSFTVFFNVVTLFKTVCFLSKFSFVLKMVKKTCFLKTWKNTENLGEIYKKKLATLNKVKIIIVAFILKTNRFIKYFFSTGSLHIVLFS